jgi:hypothetical protein
VRRLLIAIAQARVGWLEPRPIPQQVNGGEDKEHAPLSAIRLNLPNDSMTLTCVDARPDWARKVLQVVDVAQAMAQSAGGRRHSTSGRAAAVRAVATVSSTRGLLTTPASPHAC